MTRRSWIRLIALGVSAMMVRALYVLWRAALGFEGYPNESIAFVAIVTLVCVVVLARLWWELR